MFFALFGLAISWCLRSDIITLCVAFSVSADVINFLYPWTIPIVILPWVLVSVGLEHYMNEAAQNSIVRRRALKALAIEGGIGLVFFAAMGVLALAGYPPVW